MRHKLFGLLTALCGCMVVLCMSASAMEISVETPDGKTLTLEVESGDSIDNVKQMISAATGISKDDQYLYFSGKLLVDFALSDYNVQKGSILWLSENEIPEPTGTALTNKTISEHMTLSGGAYYLDAIVQAGGYSVKSIEISSSLTITGNVTLDLNGYVLKMTGAGSVIYVEPGATLTLTDSKPRAIHKFTPAANDLWVLDETNGTEAVRGGVITGGTGADVTSPGGMASYRGGGVLIEVGGSLTMTGGNIVGCTAHDGGGVYLNGLHGPVDQTSFTMSGGSIVGCCTTNGPEGGGGVLVQGGTFTMSGGSIHHCTAIGDGITGGGVLIINKGSFTLSNGEIRTCKCIAAGSRARGGGVYVSWNCTFTMSGGSIADCGVQSGDQGFAQGGGVYNGVGTFIMNGGLIASDCTATGGGGGVCNETGTLYANGGEIAGDVMNGTPEGGGLGTITGSGGTKFSGKVTNCKHDNEISVIESGTFTGEVTNDGGKITGGIFYGTVNNYGTITGGTFSSGITGDPALVTGSGTETDPFQISTAEGLKWFRDKVNGSNGQTQNAGAHAKLMNDIVLNDGTFDENGTYTPGASGKAAEKWTPIAYSGLFNEHTTLYYTGTFDGQGHTIKGLYVSINNATSIGDAVCLGLFSTAKKAVIRNVTVTGYVFGFAGNLGGIVGYLSDGTIENCANYCTVKSTLADTEGPSYGGGIAGAMDKGSVIRDCYNTGTITVVEYREWNMTGGVVGYSDDSAVSNCYNAGKVAGSWNYNGEIAGGSNAGDENGNPSTVSNCYYLDGTGWNAVGNGKGSITNTESKTAAQFANGTVLALLKAGARTGTDPWATECKYLTAAGRTLPVFKGQGNAHTHNAVNPNNWEFNETEHWQVCACGAVFNKRGHSGGTANCTEKAVCADCGAKYGNTNSNNHDDKLKHVEAKAATTSEEGNIEYWYCEACGKYYSDAGAENEIPQSETVIPKRHSSGGGSGGSSSYPITVPGKTENGTLTVSPRSAEKGDSVTITVKPDSGYQLDDLAVTDKNGKELKLTDKGNGKYTFTMPSGKVKINATFTKEAEPSPFSDVSTSAYYYEAIKWAAENGITGGVGNSLFAPNQPCTRAQIVTFLWRAAGSPVVNYLMPFTDVDEGAYYAEAVRWAASTGIVTGLTETTFGTDSVCTRAQAAAMIYRCAQAQGKGFTGAWMFHLPFTDVPEWAYESVAWCYMNGVTTGVSETSFAPGNDCTRAQIVTFLWRAFSK